MMLSRSAFRVMQPLCAHTRRYATESTPHNLRPSGGGGGGGGGTAKRSSTNLLVIAASTLVAGGAAYFLLGGKPAPRETKGAPSRVTTDAATSSLPPSPRAEGAGGGAGARSALTGGDQGFVSLLLDKVDIVNHNTKKFTFKLPEEDMVSGLHVASAVLTRFQAPAAEKAVIRPYTPISSEDTNGYLELLVKRYPDGPMSSHLHDMQPGQRLDFKGPLPKYPWTANQHSHVALIAGGTGITPMFQLARHILANPQDNTKITLVFGNVSEEDILLKPELARLENTFPQRFRAFYVLDRPATSWPGGRGFINRELLQTVLPEPKQAGVKVFVCGPPGMMRAISGEKKSPREQGDLVGALKELGYSPDQVYKF